MKKVNKPLLLLTLASGLVISSAASAEFDDLVKNSGCLTCHALQAETKSDELPVAPSFAEVRDRFYAEKGDYEYLKYVILYGTSPYESRWKGKITGQSMPPNHAILSEHTINKLLIGILDYR